MITRKLNLSGNKHKDKEELTYEDLVYHGSYKPIEKPKILVSKFNKDFGNGFYVTRLEHQAVKWARRKNTSFVSIYNYRLLKGLNVKIFEGIDLDWLHFIRDCRLGKGHNCDIVEGPMADDQVYDWVQQYEDGRIDDEQFLVLCKFKHPTHQICFCSDSALDCLTFITSKEV